MSKIFQPKGGIVVAVHKNHGKSSNKEQSSKAEKIAKESKVSASKKPGLLPKGQTTKKKKDPRIAKKKGPRVSPKTKVTAPKNNKKVDKFGSAPEKISRHTKKNSQPNSDTRSETKTNTQAKNSRLGGVVKAVSKLVKTVIKETLSHDNAPKISSSKVPKRGKPSQQSAPQKSSLMPVFESGAANKDKIEENKVIKTGKISRSKVKNPAAVPVSQEPTASIEAFGSETTSKASKLDKFARDYSAKSEKDENIKTKLEPNEVEKVEFTLTTEPLAPIEISAAEMFRPGHQLRKERISFDQPIRFFWQGRFETATIVNISKTGLCLHSQFPIDPHNELKINFPLPYSGETILLTAKSVWTKENIIKEESEADLSAQVVLETVTVSEVVSMPLGEVFTETFSATSEISPVVSNNPGIINIEKNNPYFKDYSKIPGFLTGLRFQQLAEQKKSLLDKVFRDRKDELIRIKIGLLKGKVEVSRDMLVDEAAVVDTDESDVALDVPISKVGDDTIF